MQFLHSLKVPEIDPDTFDLFIATLSLHKDRDEFWCFTTFQLNTGKAMIS